MTSHKLILKDICKSFFGVMVLNHISLDIKVGEVHAIVGENGAGKSTLTKIITGAYKKDIGKIYLDNKEREFKTPSEAYNNGIGIIYQETNLVDKLSILENIFLGIEFKTKLGLLDKRKMLEKFRSFSNEMGFKFDPHKSVQSLSTADKKIVEIMKCLIRESDLIIMDEPTDSLSDNESNKLFKKIHDLKVNKVTIIYITHNLSEIFKVANRVTVLRDGKIVGTAGISQLDTKKVVNMMIGKQEQFKKNIISTQEVGIEVFRIQSLSYLNKLKKISFCIYKGEVLGIAGKVGAGKSELARCIFGANKNNSGKYFLENEEVLIRTPKEAIKNGLVMIPEDRKKDGLLLNHSVIINSTISSLNKHLSLGIISNKSEKISTKRVIDKLKVKSVNLNQNVKSLSGGNQQKIVLGKWFETNPKIFILDEPTRGIDIGSKIKIYRIIKDLVIQGKSIVFISNDIQEIVELCDRIIILRDGFIKSILPKGTTENEVFQLIHGDVNE